MVWDTNIVIDYLQHGPALWQVTDGDDSFDEVSAKHLPDLELLRVLLAVWIVRSVEFAILPRSITDARTTLDIERQRGRRQLMLEFDRALSLVGAPDDDASAVFPARPADLESTLRVVPEGGDCDLVEAAWQRGAHVFLTCDERVRRTRPALASLGWYR